MGVDRGHGTHGGPCPPASVTLQGDSGQVSITESHVINTMHAGKALRGLGGKSQGTHSAVPLRSDNEHTGWELTSLPRCLFKARAPILGAPRSPQSEGCTWLHGVGCSARHSALGPRGVTVSSPEVSSVHTGALQTLKGSTSVKTGLASTPDAWPFSE